MAKKCRLCGGIDVTVFAKVTASPKVLAEKLVIPSFVGHEGYLSVLTLKIFNTKEEAIAATVAKLNEVEK